jgi:hypothetical protein
MVTAQTAVPGIVFDGTSHYCRNPADATAWLESRHHTAADQALEWWSVVCNRNRIDWACDVPTLHRQVDITQPIAGAAHRVTIQFDQYTPIERARALTRRAIDMFWADAESEVPRQCSQPVQSDRTAWELTRKEYQRELSSSPLFATVSTDDRASEVLLFSNGGPAFDFKPGSGASDLDFDCWTMWIVVT